MARVWTARYNPANFKNHPIFKGNNMRKVWLVLWSGLLLASGLQAATPLNVPVTAGTHIYFKGDDNRREQTVDVNLPENIDAYGKVTLRFSLSCPSGKCDPWDRVGSMAVKDINGNRQFLEVLRFITPYGIGADWKYDVSDFLPLLKGKQTFKFFIDTWVGPGSAYGNGWMIAAELIYEEAKDRPVAALVLPVLSFEDVVYGDPLKTSERVGKVQPLLGYSSAQLYTVITGHGQGNELNCAEFCAKTHSVQVGTEVFSKRIWRDDCATTVDPNQKGNYKYPRAGWCPGDKVNAWKADVSSALFNGETEVRYAPEAFENTCRPGLTDCKSCVFGTPCDYDGGLHTEPRYYVSSYIIYYK